MQEPLIEEGKHCGSCKCELNPGLSQSHRGMHHSSCETCSCSGLDFDRETFSVRCKMFAFLLVSAVFWTLLSVFAVHYLAEPLQPEPKFHLQFSGPDATNGGTNGSNAKEIAKQMPVYGWQFATLTLLIGLQKHGIMQATTMTLVAFLSILGGCIPSCIIVLKSPHILVKNGIHDFVQKGTLSNSSQQVTMANGRIWAVALFTAGMLMLTSTFPMWVYRPWDTLESRQTNPWRTPIWIMGTERFVKTLWGVVPYVGFIFTASIPSLSNVSGYKLFLTGVHNVAAPLSMLYCMVMETIQLGYGENAFSAFFSEAPASVYGPLTEFQRARVCVIFIAWSAGFVFIGVQAYLAFVPNKIYVIALISFFGEVIGIVLAFLLPALAGLEQTFTNQQGSMYEVAAKLTYYGAQEMRVFPGPPTNQTR